ncbi:hypothetical protein DKX38_015881 [Salix brachista]|uniref:Uncharacterized protein n=1 Tax=Salix brachista TaxID=2182728 RepID=A0A5N5L745_9ROSI|nr:hypothetical protein DKX38_015881 [Salix brachista]
MDSDSAVQVSAARVSEAVDTNSMDDDFEGVNGVTNGRVNENADALPAFESHGRRKKSIEADMEADMAKLLLTWPSENISSLEVENVLYTHEAMYEVSVVARPDEYWGEAPGADACLLGSKI